MAEPDYKRLMASALIELKDLKAKLKALETRQHEPIAIVGMGCRFPGGGDTPEAFWRVLRDGIDTVRDIPPDRWDVDAFYDRDPEVPGKTPVRDGAFLDRVDTFDPGFFGIAPREARTLDPQHRLLLEVTWEALENAGLAPDQLSGRPVGVYLGLMNQDYAHRQGEGHSVDPYLISGNDLSFASGRVSYTLGLRGPSMVIATACSSSLVSTHLACQALRHRECDLALSGGVNVILYPLTSVILSRLGALSHDGRCKTFDASADGYGRGEGCGIVVLKRLADAITDGDTVLAVIRGSAINHGGPSTGLTVPSGDAQEAVLREALEAARTDPTAVEFVETHGTGTILGDPIELRSLVNVMGPGRETPLLVGSVKTNVGHLEAAAGVVSLIKVILALRHEAIPPHLHVKSPNPHVPWDVMPVKVTTALTPWPKRRTPRIAGVSSFGLSGANAHMIVEEAPFQPRRPMDVERPLHLLALSAKTEKALQALSADYATYFGDHPDLDFADVCFTTNTGRAQFPYRRSVVAASLDGARDLLTRVTTPGVAGLHPPATAKGRPPKVAFLFAGEGAPYLGMGAELYRTQPTFRRVLDRCDERLRPYLGASLVELLYAGIEELDPENDRSPGSPTLDDPAVAPLALCALEYALAELWTSWNITPDVVMGQGVGEYVAACVAGVFGLDDALTLIAGRQQAERVARQVTYVKPRLALVSRLTGRLAGDEVASPDYWLTSSTRPDQLASGFASLHQRGVNALLEIGPHATLLEMGRACWPESDAAWLPSLRSGHDWTQMLASLAELYARGAPVDWKGFERDYARGRRRVALPTYPFQRQRYWALDDQTRGLPSVPR